MTSVIKPIPEHHFHDYDDDLLKSLIKFWRATIENKSGHEIACRQLIDEAYKILGYRCALEYIEMYGDK